MPRSSDRGGDRLASDNSDEPETGNQTNSVPSATHAGVPHGGLPARDWAPDRDPLLLGLFRLVRIKPSRDGLLAPRASAAQPKHAFARCAALATLSDVDVLRSGSRRSTRPARRRVIRLARDRTRASTRTMASTARGHAAPILARRRRGAPGRAARVVARAAPRTWATPRRGETLAGCLRASPSAFPPTTTRGTRSFLTRPRAAVGGGLAGRPEDGEDAEDAEDDERAPSDPFASFASDHPPRDAARDDDFSFLRDAESDLARGPDDPDDPNASSDPNRAAAASDDSASSAETPSSAAGALAVEYACGPGQLKLNLLAAACGTQNPNNAGVLRDFLESLRANASANAAPFVGGGGASSSTQHGWWHDFFFHAPTEPFHGRWASELTFVAHHPLAFSGVVFAAVLAHGAWRRQRSRVMALKADFLADGVDLTRVDDRVETLTYLREMKKKGALALGLETAAAKRAVTEITFLGPAALRNWRAYYGERDIDLARVADVERVRAYVRDVHYLEGCLRDKKEEEEEDKEEEQGFSSAGEANEARGERRRGEASDSEGGESNAGGREREDADDAANEP